MICNGTGENVDKEPNQTDSSNDAGPNPEEEEATKNVRAPEEDDTKDAPTEITYIINPSKMEVAPQGCLNVIIQKTKIKLT